MSEVQIFTPFQVSFMDNIRLDSIFFDLSFKKHIFSPSNRLTKKTLTIRREEKIRLTNLSNDYDIAKHYLGDHSNM